MKTYRNDKLGFEMNVPEEWSLPKSGASHTPFRESIVFGCKYFEEFSLQIDHLKKEQANE